MEIERSRMLAVESTTREQSLRDELSSLKALLTSAERDRDASLRRATDAEVETKELREKKVRE